MNLNKIVIPPNSKFGKFFSFIFFLCACYFLINGNLTVSIFFIILTIIFLIIAITNPDLLQPLNRLWAMLGFLIGFIVSPIIMSIIFFVIFSPIGILMKLFQRDYLEIKNVKRSTMWKKRTNYFLDDVSLRNQF